MKKMLLASLVATGFAYANQPHTFTNPNTTLHTYEFTNTYDLVVPKGASGQTNLWVPLPFDSDYQNVKSIEFEGNYNKAFITENNQYGAKTLYANWNDKAEKRLLKVKMVVQTQDREYGKTGALSQYQMPEKIEYSIDVQPYLKATDHIKIDGIVKKTADKIVGNETNPLKKAELIHQWIVKNMERDNSVLGCGDGDVEKILTTGVLKGKCTDIN